MAKAKTGGTRSYLRGRVGSDVYSIGKDAKGNKQQIVRSLAESVANPQTIAQMRGRMIMSTVMQAVSAMAVVIDHSFDNVTAGQPSVSEFIKRNYALIKADVAAHPESDNIFGLNIYGEKGIKQGAYVMSDGSAANISGVVVDATAKTLTIALASGATVADLRSALGIAADDYFTIVAITDNSEFIYNRFHVSQSIADDTVISADTLASVFTIDGNVSVSFGLSGNNIVATLGNLSANFGIIVSRKASTGYKHNDCTLAAPSAPQYNASVALATYPVGQQRFLNGGAEAGGSVEPAPVINPIEVSNLKYNGASITQGYVIAFNDEGNNHPFTFDAANVADNGGAKVQLSTAATSLEGATDLLTVADGANTIATRSYTANTSIWFVPNSGTPWMIARFVESSD